MISAADRPVALAVVGTLVPDTERFHGPAFNRAAQMFQDELVRALATTAFPPSAVFSVEPMPAFPRSSRIVCRSASLTTYRGSAVRLLPYINIQPLKPLTAGLSVLAALVSWSIRHRASVRIIHCFNLAMPPGILLLLAARLTGSRVVVSLLDLWKPGALVPDSWKWRLNFWLERRLIPRFDGLTVVSQAMADDMAPGRRVCLLEGGVAPDRFERRPRPTRGPGAPFRVVLAGSLEEFNGVSLTLDALDRLPSDCELVIAGAGSLADRVRARAEADSRVTYLGFLGFDEVLDLYASSDLLLNVRLTRAIDTRYSFPSKLMELLASGTPVLSTCTGHVEADFGDVLYLLREETPVALASRIQQIARLSAEDRAALAERAREMLFGSRTWARQAERLAAYLRTEVLDETA